MRKKLKVLGIGMASSLILLTGCQSGGKQVSAAEMVSKAIEAENKGDNFYGEAIIKMDVMGEKQSFDLQEFNSKDGSKKYIMRDKNSGAESILLLTDGKLTAYEKTEKKAMQTKLDKDVVGTFSPKDQFLNMLEMTKDTHSYKVIGEAKVLGRKTNHLELKAKKKESLLGDIEVWVDQKTWLPLKMKSITENGKSEMEYKKVDFSPEFKAGTFKIDIPKDVKIEKIDPNKPEEIVGLEGVKSELGKSVLLLPEDNLKLDRIEKTESIGRSEFNFEYVDKGGKPYVTMTVFSPEGVGPIEGNKKVRGQSAEVTEEINALMWDEDGLRYVLLPVDMDQVSIKDLEKLAEKMKLSK